MKYDYVWVEPNSRSGMLLYTCRAGGSLNPLTSAKPAFAPFRAAFFAFAAGLDPELPLPEALLRWSRTKPPEAIMPIVGRFPDRPVLQIATPTGFLTLGEAMAMKTAYTPKFKALSLPGAFRGGVSRERYAKALSGVPVETVARLWEIGQQAPEFANVAVAHNGEVVTIF